MAPKGPKGKESEQSGGLTGFGDLRQEFGKFLGGLADEWTQKAGDKVSGLTDRLTDVADGQGGMLGAGNRMLHGDSPFKAMVGQKAKDTKDKVVGKVKDTVGGGGGSGTGENVKAVNIVESLDVGVSRRTAYDNWTQFEDFSSFTKGVRGVSQEEDEVTTWNLKIGPSSRSWKATTQEQIPDERIVWTSEGAKGSTTGCVSFHELGPSLTRILVVVEYTPAGFFEKTANLWRAQGRRLRLDLKHFGRHVTLHADDEVEGWRGEIRDGEVVRSHEEGLEDDEQGENGPEEDDEDYGPEDEDAYDEGEGAGEDGEEDWDEEEGEPEDEEEGEEGEEEEPAKEEEDDEEEQAPRRRRSRR
ncbi:SRPBCC family protein [Actinacidiphila epipremni]|uniref:SRPBCC family protein n=1 Tax=Actinacidiphila epipremni TaxID=2053013 RepID=A0ABX0ZVV3_9ACTN|nr:SRPBCC family protein [Actinacidiphila epipremni]NJP45736.1 SRPBCC family protein [Actinacidiphila epipremni]